MFKSHLKEFESSFYLTVIFSLVFIVWMQHKRVEGLDVC